MDNNQFNPTAKEIEENPIFELWKSQTDNRDLDTLLRQEDIT